MSEHTQLCDALLTDKPRYVDMSCPSLGPLVDLSTAGKIYSLVPKQQHLPQVTCSSKGDDRLSDHWHLQYRHEEEVRDEPSFDQR